VYVGVFVYVVYPTGLCAQGSSTGNIYKNIYFSICVCLCVCVFVCVVYPTRVRARGASTGSMYIDMNIFMYMYVYVYMYLYTLYIPRGCVHEEQAQVTCVLKWYGVATNSRLLKLICLFCKRAP